MSKFRYFTQANNMLAKRKKKKKMKIMDLLRKVNKKN